MKSKDAQLETSDETLLTLALLVPRGDSALPKVASTTGP